MRTSIYSIVLSKIGIGYPQVYQDHHLTARGCVAIATPSKHHTDQQIRTMIVHTGTGL